MNNLLGEILSRHPEEKVTREILNLVLESGYGSVQPEHIMHVWLKQPGDPWVPVVESMNLDATMLADQIRDSLPPVSDPCLPPDKLDEGALDTSLHEVAGSGQFSSGVEVLLNSLGQGARDLLAFAGVWEPMLAAGSGPEKGSAEEEPTATNSLSFFTDEGLLNSEIFSERAHNLLGLASRKCGEFGRRKLAMPLVLLAALQEGPLADCLKAFQSQSEAAINQVRMALGRSGPPTDPPELSRVNCEQSFLDWVELVEQTAERTKATRLDEVVLLESLCLFHSAIMAAQWEMLGLTPEKARPFMTMGVDDSPLHGTVVVKEVLKSDDVLKLLQQEIIGQARPIQQVRPVIRGWLNGVRSPDRPAGFALFMGPPGVGKTELSRAMAKILYGSRESLCFVEMNQQKEKHSVSKLIGSPPGYQGPDSGVLTDWIRDNPESIILLDEVEKAHPEVVDVLLRLLNEGRISDAAGREYDATGILVIMTSNIGQDQGIFDQIHREQASDEEYRPERDNPLLRPEIKDLLHRHFRPEFVGRMRNVVLFNELCEEDFLQITRLQLDKLVAYCMENWRVEVTYQDELVPFIAGQTQRLQQGARGAINYVQDNLRDEILAARENTPDLTEFELKVPEGYEHGRA
jgi:energy-coupling factor transporter ATP-binding protein EcfA2